MKRTLLQLGTGVGTNINNCSYYCHQASGVTAVGGGSGTATVVLEDVDQADCIFVIGGNPASNHPPDDQLDASAAARRKSRGDQSGTRNRHGEVSRSK